MDEVIAELVLQHKLLDSLHVEIAKIADHFEGIHLRYAPIMTDLTYYELSIPFALLDDVTQEDLEPYLETKNLETDNELITLNVFPENSLSSVLEILGLEEPVDVSFFEEINNKLLDKHVTIFEILSSLKYEGREEEEYFGTLYYPKLRKGKLKFSIDETSIFIMDHTLDSVPTIHRVPYQSSIEAVIKDVCLSSKDLDFYTMV